MPELQHMNQPEWPNYLKVYKPRKIKIIDQKAIASKPIAGVFKVKKLGKSEPFDEEAFRRMVQSCKMRSKMEASHDIRQITHMSLFRTQPFRQ